MHAKKSVRPWWRCADFCGFTTGPKDSSKEQFKRILRADLNALQHQRQLFLLLQNVVLRIGHGQCGLSRAFLRSKVVMFHFMNVKKQKTFIQKLLNRPNLFTVPIDTELVLSHGAPQSSNVSRAVTRSLIPLLTWTHQGLLGI